MDEGDGDIRMQELGLSGEFDSNGAWTLAFSIRVMVRVRCVPPPITATPLEALRMRSKDSPVSARYSSLANDLGALGYSRRRPVHAIK